MQRPFFGWLVCIIAAMGGIKVAHSSAEDDQLIGMRLAYIGAQNASLFWGPYRPQVYFGMRSRSPRSLLTGIMWHSLRDYQLRVRHSCEQGDGLASYEWIHNDGRTFGTEVIRDPENNLRLDIQLLKYTEVAEGGGSYTVRVTGAPLDKTKGMEVSLAYYMAYNGPEGDLEFKNAFNEGLAREHNIHGYAPEYGNFDLFIFDDTESVDDDDNEDTYDASKWQYMGTKIPEEHIWKAKDIYESVLVDRTRQYVQQHGEENVPPPRVLMRLPNYRQDEMNLAIVQKAFRTAFQFDLVFVNSPQSTAASAVEQKAKTMTGSAFTDKFQKQVNEFDNRFEDAFELEAKGFNNKQIAFAKTMLGSMFGSVGYFYGDSVVNFHVRDGGVKSADDDELDALLGDEEEVSGEGYPEKVPPTQLFASAPSRPFFPRGFLWDEGFHQVLISQWDISLTFEMLQSWANLINEDGWVAREQILGDEARSKVPTEFQTQFTHYANPPTLILPLVSFVDKLTHHFSQPINYEASLPDIVTSESLLAGEGLLSKLLNTDIALVRSLLKDIYEKFKRHFEWFRKTQRGSRFPDPKPSLKEEIYRWRGRTPNHCLTSGLDDYPRINPPSDYELHVDLTSWVGFYADSLYQLARFLGEKEYADDIKHFKEVKKSIIETLDKTHWNPETKSYCDVSFNETSKTPIKICHNGYLSLFPFLFNLIPEKSSKVDAVLDLIRNPEELWTDYGLRSLSASDHHFGTKENYWRGPIWINMNVLVLRALKKYYVPTISTYHKKAEGIYKELRENLVSNIFGEYERTGFAWEQYSPETGRGQRSHPFTGWTALVVNIMSEKY